MLTASTAPVMKVRTSRKPGSGPWAALRRTVSRLAIAALARSGWVFGPNLAQYLPIEGHVHRIVAPRHERNCVPPDSPLAIREKTTAC